MSHPTPTILQLSVGPMANFAYLVADDSAKLAAVVDPGWEAKTLLAAAADRGWTIDAVWLTHNHFDHIGALEDLCALANPRAVYIHAADADGLPTLATPIIITHDGDAIPLGALRAECLHTPGHTPGGQCFLLGQHCITGDTLFVNACGRVDLPGSDPHAMFTSLQRLAQLPPETMLYGGHDYGPTPTSTIGAQRTSNPYLRAGSESEFFQNRGV